MLVRREDEASGEMDRQDVNVSAALGLAAWVMARLARAGRAVPATHMEVGALCFYGYGALLAEELEMETGVIAFEAWAHGPVSPATFAAYGERDAEPILEAFGPASAFSERARSCIDDVLNVYGRLLGRGLRQEARFEAPWASTAEPARRVPIPASRLRAHFKARFGAGERVEFPDRLFGTSSLRLDRGAVPTFGSLREMSAAVTRILGPAADA